MTMPAPPFRSVLIANRGEIACRIIRSCRRLGMRCATIHSPADANALHVRLADVSHCIEGDSPRHSYLNIAGIIKAGGGAYEALHPGYGFLSENPELAAACAATTGGPTFIGPPPAVIEVMGDKSKARALAEQAGVAPTPGYHGADQSLATLRREAARIGYPVLVKAAAGGGGKGMKQAANAEALDEAVASAQREAAAAFGDERLILERYFHNTRHVEVQIFADRHGNCIHLFERDCSLQRRFQKVIEEAPCPLLDESQREALGAAAVAIARQAGYINAGTVEFLLDEDGSFYFMEMNTRLQVEHPVTEMICGLDLVEWQLRVAAGEPLPLAQQQLARLGHAIEARIYAERPEADFLPSTGVIEALEWPRRGGAEASPPQLRIDSGVAAGDEVTMHFDPLLAKIIACGHSRPQAAHTLARALEQTRISGVHTNTAWLRRVLRAWFAHDDNHIRNMPQLFAQLADSDQRWHNIGFVMAALAAAFVGALPGLRLNRPSEFRFYDEQGRAVAVTVAATAEEHGSRVRVQVSEDEHEEYHLHRINRVAEDAAAVVVVTATPAAGHAERLEARIHTRTIAAGHDVLDVFSSITEVGGAGATTHAVMHTANPAAAAHGGAGGGEDGEVRAPMPGRVIKVFAVAGGEVAQGEALLVLEAMKMEHVITAPCAGIVTRLSCSEGRQVTEGAPLVLVTAPQNEADGDNAPA